MTLLKRSGTYLSRTPKLESTATADQTEFVTTFNVTQVFVDGILQDSGYTGYGTTTITFDVGLSEGQKVILFG